MKSSTISLERERERERERESWNGSVYCNDNEKFHFVYYFQTNGIFYSFYPYRNVRRVGGW